MPEILPALEKCKTICLRRRNIYLIRASSGAYDREMYQVFNMGQRLEIIQTGAATI